MFFFNTPNFRKMRDERDVDGLVKLLDRPDPLVRLEAAQALAELGDGRGWRYLLDVVARPQDPRVQAAAAEILGSLGQQRAVPALEAAMPAARGEALEAIRAALAAIEGGLHASQPIAPVTSEPQERPVTYNLAGGQVLEAEEALPPMLPRAEMVTFHTAEEHLDSAAQLREAELQERGLVETTLALWLSPNWAGARYLRGVLFEDLERLREASLAYTDALALDPDLSDAQEALTDLDEELGPPEAVDLLVRKLHDNDWHTRRDAAAVLGWMEQLPGQHPQVVEGLLNVLSDPDREVRHAAIEALGRLDAHQAMAPLLAQQESSWLLRTAVLAALAEMGVAGAVAERLRTEMAAFQERNPVFTSHRDPLLEIEYDLLLEMGVLALEQTGDVEGLLAEVEGLTWVSEDEESDEDADEADDEEDEEAVEDAEELLSYVDETSLMIALALERLAGRKMATLPEETLERLAAVPDVELLDLNEPDAQPITVHDLSELRAQARDEFQKR